MKLRSGKVLKQPLPAVLKEKLDSNLKKFKELLTNNEDFAKELIQLISFSSYFAETRCVIHERIKEVFDDNDIKVQENVDALLAICGSLLRLITQNDSVYRNYHIQSNYHNIIQEKMLEAFDIDVSLTGTIDQNDNIEI